MKKIALIIPFLFLAGCQTTQPVITSQKLVVADVPVTLFNCPRLGKTPNPTTLTDGEVAALIIDLARNNKKCADSLSAIRRYIEVQKHQLNR